MNSLDVLLVEDNADEAKLSIRAFEKNNIAKNIIWLKDGEEAENLIFAKGQYASRIFMQTRNVAFGSLAS